ncbi:MAG: noncanonical pyrimidine nucleotidase, YjjG family [Saprospiraceae bacterium]|nr:noncanonical pyrimidine nucleotidase, YjjG family [Saprospiraceae bacterium]
MRSYDWLLFDLDNTILDFNASSVIAFNRIMEDLGLEEDPELVRRFKKYNLQVWGEMEKGLIDHQQLKSKRWSLFFNSINIQMDPVEANNIYFELIKSNPVFVDHAFEIIQKGSLSHQLMIITNGLSEVQRPRLEITRLTNYFRHIVISDELGHAKPHKAYFDHCHDLMNAPDKERVLVIGDTLHSDILGGKNFGYHTCWYNYSNNENEGVPTDYEIKDLRELGGILEMGMT